MAKTNFFSATALNAARKANTDAPIWQTFDLSRNAHYQTQAQWNKLNSDTATAALARKYIQAQTLDYINKHEDMLEVSESTLVKATTKFPDVKKPFAPKNKKDKKTSYKTNISVKAIDCLYAAEEFVKQGKSVAVLNMANQFRKGGGYKNGAGAQEEDLFRRTNLISSLDEAHYAQTANADKEKNGFGENNALYSDKVTVFRKGADQNYIFLRTKDHFTISVISSAAYNLKFSNVKERSKRYQTGMESKIIMQLETALLHGHKNLVLSAFGCGAFANNPKVVSELYKKVLNTPRYKNAFENIQFAIIPNPGASNDNYAPFKAAFRQKDIPVIENVQNIKKALKREWKYRPMLLSVSALFGIIAGSLTIGVSLSAAIICSFGAFALSYVLLPHLERSDNNSSLMMRIKAKDDAKSFPLAKNFEKTYTPLQKRQHKEKENNQQNTTTCESKCKRKLKFA